MGPVETYVLIETANKYICTWIILYIYLCPSCGL